MYIENKQLKIYLSYWLALMFWLISLMIIVGGLTRLTDSGLAITTWELFSGLVPPLNNSDWINYFNLYKQIPEFKLQNYSMSLKEFKVIFWWEWIHRFLGRVVGILFLIPLIYFSFKISFKKLINLYLIFFLICFQGFIGWYMVSSGLVDRVDVSHFRLSIHLLMAFVILSMILWNYLKLKKFNIFNKLNLKLPLTFIILLFIQIVIGAFVSGLDAGKIYNSWPLMGSNYFPDDNNISNLISIHVFSEPSLVQFIHRNLAYIILVFFIFIFYKIVKNKLYDFLKPILIVGFLLIIQVILGIFTILYGAKIIFSSMHQISSIFLIASSIYLLYLSYLSKQQLSN